MDETALALARLREEAKAEKPQGPGKTAPSATTSRLSQAASGRRPSNAPAPPATTKRQKSG